MQELISENWKGYELIASGDGERLERIGTHTAVRPDPNVIWPKGTSADQRWQQPDLLFVGGEEKWQLRNPALEEGWVIEWNTVKLKVKPTPFRHIGVFPEQAVNWQWLEEIITTAGRPLSVLNLFAYTGASTIVAAKAGADVTHVDASKGTVFWASDNAQLSGLGKDAARWIVDDAVKFMQREVRRGNRYDIILMDPPVFGRGPKGEIWRLHEGLPTLLTLADQLFSEQPLGFLLNFYATELYPHAVLRLAKEQLGHRFPSLDVYSLMLRESEGEKQLATGFCLRS